MKECPRCKLLNPPGAERCDCGYALQVAASAQTPEMLAPYSRYPAWKIVNVAGWSVIGLVGLAFAFAMVYLSGTALGFGVLFLTPWCGGALVLGAVLLGVSSWMKGRS